ncbi:MAG: hypothetical protein R3C68_08700 [Myxococcota bacterium]
MALRVASIDQFVHHLGSMPILAAIDAGSNAVRLLMVALDDWGIARHRRYKRYALRLGGDVFARGSLSNETITALVGVFTDIRRRMEHFGVGHYRAVATSAMRDAKNGPAIVRRIARQTGIALEIIDGIEESRLSRSAMRRSLGMVPEGALFVDLGGGSLEVERLGAARGKSLPLGTVRLLERYPALGQAQSKSQMEGLARGILEDLKRCLPRRHRAPIAIGTGGNLEILAELLPCRYGQNSAIDVTGLTALSYKLGGLTLRERSRRYKLRSDRADLIVGAALVLKALVEAYGIDHFVIPKTGLREGILQHLLAAKDPQEATVHKTLRRWGVDTQRARSRAALGWQLFVGLGSTHNLWDSAAPLLRTAALCLDAGQMISQSNWQAHTLYLLEHTQDLGLLRQQQTNVLCVLAHALGTTSKAAHTLDSAATDAMGHLGRVLALAELLLTHGVTGITAVQLDARKMVLSVKSPPGGSWAIPTPKRRVVEKMFQCQILVRLGG